jgi:hypothetical protein
MPAERRKLLAAAWASFRERVMSPNAPPDQVEHMRNAFYAGFATLWDILMRKTTSSSEVEEADLALMDDLNEEMGEFARQLAQRVGVDWEQLIGRRRQ